MKKRAGARGTIKHKVKRFKSLEEALKELKPFIRNGKHLWSGRPFKSLGGMRSREALANWLVCAAVNAEGGRKLTFSSDPIGGDGIIIDSATDEGWPTEHILARGRTSGKSGAADDAQTLILRAVRQKIAKGGAAYAKGKALIVFLEGAGSEPWFPNRVAQDLPNPLHFTEVWVVALQRVEESGGYIYGVTLLDLGHGNAPTYLVRITGDFTSWSVTLQQ